MKLLNPNEHSSCFYYGCEGKPIIEMRRFERGYKQKLVFEYNEVILVMEGKLRFTYKDYPPQTIEKGRFCFVPSAGVFNFTATGKSAVMVIRLPGNAHLCTGCTVEDLYADKTEGDMPGSCVRRTITTLEIVPPLRYFLEGVNASIGSGLNCRYYHETKIKEMMILIRAYYSREDLRALFNTVLSPDTGFSEFVRINHSKYKTVAELADACNMSPKNFARKFAGVFNETPVRWMNTERARAIHHELVSGNKPFGQIAYENGFSDQAHFNKFCKKYLGENPGGIRVRRNNTKEWEKKTKNN